MLQGTWVVVSSTLGLILLIHNMTPVSVVHPITSNFSVNQAGAFSWLSEFTYEMDAPDQIKEFSNKTIEKTYRLSNVHYEVAGAKIGAVLVILNLESQPMNDQETRIDFDAKAMHVYAKNDHFDVKKKRAQVTGYSILNSQTEKISMHIPWAEILKNV